jgi:hypothetical protein
MTFPRRSIKDTPARAPGKKVAWDQNQNDLDRLEQRKNINGHYINCRHYSPSPGGNEKLICQKHGELDTCLNCGTCPRCNGTMSITADAHAYHIMQRYMIESATCVQCGEYHEIRRVKVETLKKPPPPKPKRTETVPRCEVIGCECRVWDDKRILFDGEDTRVCETHLRQMKRWLRRTIGLPCPLITTLEGIKENPKYKKQPLVKGK